MNQPQSKAEIIAELSKIQTGLSQTIQELSPEQFEASNGAEWSAASYLKHLILSIKPFAKALNLPKEQLASLFGKPAQPSKSYDELVTIYKGRLAEGIKAENYESVTPSFYRLPEDLKDIQAYLLQVWNESNTKLIKVLENWEEADLDQYQLPHPAIGALSIREMYFFTIHHNNLHWHDIQAVAV